MRIALYSSSSHPYLYNYPIFTSLLLPELVHLLPCLLLQATCSPVHSSTCQLATLSCLRHTLSLSLYSVTPRTCSSVTLSSFTHNLLTRLLVNLSTRHVTPRTCSSVTMLPFVPQRPLPQWGIKSLRSRD